MILNIDKRPVKIISVFDGSYNIDNYGVSYWWRQEESAINTLISNITSYYDIGYRRFFLYLPTGNAPASSGNFSSSIWNPMESWKKNGLLNEFKSFWQEKKEEGCSLGIMCGYDIPDDYDLDKVEIGYPSTVEDRNIFDNNPFHTPSIDKNEDLSYIRNNWINWINIGLNEILFIESNKKYSYYNLLDISNVFNLRKIKTHSNFFVYNHESVNSYLLPVTGYYKNYKQVLEESKITSLSSIFKNTEIGVIIEDDDDLNEQEIYNMNIKENITIWTFDNGTYDGIIQNLIKYKYGSNSIQ